MKLRMAARSRFSTSTVIVSEYLVPWLSAEGPLSYSPANPPASTAGLRDGTWVRDELTTQAGLDIQSPGFARDLWHAAQQSYSLERVMGVVKFGPHHVVVKTPLSNIRITTFFAGESETKIVDPSRISEVQAVGCEADFAPPME